MQGKWRWRIVRVWPKRTWFVLIEACVGHTACGYSPPICSLLIPGLATSQGHSAMNPALQLEPTLSLSPITCVWVHPSSLTLALLLFLPVVLGFPEQSTSMWTWGMKLRYLNFNHPVFLPLSDHSIPLRWMDFSFCRQEVSYWGS